MRVLLPLFAAIITSGCATTRTMTRVERPAQVALPTGSTVRVKVRATCVDVYRTPDRQRVTTKREKRKVFGLEVETSTSKVMRVDRRRRCDARSFDAHFTQRLKAQVEEALVRAGHRVVRRGAKATVTVRADVEHLRDLELVGQRQDTGQDRSCQQMCGTAACASYAFRGELNVSTTISRGRSQADSTLTAGALVDGQGYGVERLVCNRRHASRLWADPSRYDWGMAYDRAISTLAAQRLDRAFNDYEEDYVLVVFDRDIESAHNLAGVDLVRQKQWKEAAAAFEKALRDVKENAPEVDSAWLQGQVAHNIAAASMMAGRLKTAKKWVKRARKLTDDREVEALAEEIDRRIEDSRRLGKKRRRTRG